MSYNGWSNYDTWVYAVWMDNDHAVYDESRQMAKDALEAVADEDSRPSYLTAAEAARSPLADQLKELGKKTMPDLEASVWSDLLRSAFDEINWHEIAENLITEVKE